MKNTIENALNVQVHKLDYSNEKLILETRGDLLKAAKTCIEEAEVHDRKGKTEEALKCDVNFHKIKNKIQEIDNQIEKQGGEYSNKFIKRSDNESFPFGSEGSNAPQTIQTGTKFLKKSDRFFNQDKIKKDEDSLSAGSFLRAAVMKPNSSLERSAIQNSVTSSGFVLPIGVAAQVIDKLREVNPLIQAGAMSVELPPESETKFVRINEYPQAVWHEELAEESTDSPAFGPVTMKAKTLLSLFEVGREVEMDSANIDEAIEAAFVGSLNDAIVAASFAGGGAHAPAGLNTLVTEEEEYTELSYATMVAAQAKLFANHVPKEETSVIHSPGHWTTLNTLADATTSQPIEKPSGIREIPELVAAGVPEGISYTGQFSNVVYGFRMNLTIERHPSYSAKKFGALWLAGIRLDMAVFRPKALVRIQEDQS